MSEKPISISPTQLGNMDCRLKWHWGTRKGYRKKSLNVALDFGSVMHTFLENFYATKVTRGLKGLPMPELSTPPVDAFEAMENHLSTLESKVKGWPSDEEKFNEMSTLARKLAQGYVNHYGNDPYSEWDILATEQNLSIPLLHPVTKQPTRYRLFARLDGVVYDRQMNRYYSLEHKTFTTFDRANLEQNAQFTIQVAVGQALTEQFGLEQSLSGVIYNGIRKQAPGPRVKNAIYVRETLTRNAQQIKALTMRAFYKAEQFYGDIQIPIYPEPDTFRCNLCDFREPCKAFTRGEDPQGLLQLNYVVQRPPKTANGITPKVETEIVSAEMEMDDAD